MSSGIFTVSLDFELFWGVRDHRSIDSYGKNIANVHQVVPRLLALFTKYEIHCTWATVGFIFCTDKNDLLQNLPSVKPAYQNTNFDQYGYIEQAALEKTYHFAPELVHLIRQTPGQELATHTFSHYYTLENGTDPVSFEADLAQAKSVAERKGTPPVSIVFPRNQYSDDFLSVCRKQGISIYRGTEDSWLYRTRSRTDEKLTRRALRLADSYINLSGHHTFDAADCKEANGMWNIPSSRFLRPYSPKLKILDGLKLKRIKNAMHHAARNKEVYHIWWHPHNFGSCMEENFLFLEKILQYYTELKKKYELASLTMAEIKKTYG